MVKVEGKYTFKYVKHVNLTKSEGKFCKSRGEKGCQTEFKIFVGNRGKIWNRGNASLPQGDWRHCRRLSKVQL